MCANLEIYNKYRAVPKDAIKPFDNGKFKGTDINTMWRVKCLTECFGVCGFGWTIKVHRTWTEQGANEEIMAFAEIEMKVKLGGEWSEPFTATGGNLMVRLVKAKNGNQSYYTNNDEAFKMAITDAFGVACKYLGIGADIYWNNDRTKYTEQQDEQVTQAKYSSDNKIDKQTPTKAENEPKTSLNEPKNEITMTYDDALNHVVEVTSLAGKTLKEVYKTERAMIPIIYEQGAAKTKKAIDIIQAEIKKAKENKQ